MNLSLFFFNQIEACNGLIDEEHRASLGLDPYTRSNPVGDHWCQRESSSSTSTTFCLNHFTIWLTKGRLQDKSRHSYCTWWLIVMTRFLISTLRWNKWLQQPCHDDRPSKYNNLPENCCHFTSTSSPRPLWESARVHKSFTFFFYSATQIWRRRMHRSLQPLYPHVISVSVNLSEVLWRDLLPRGHCGVFRQLQCHDN